jgi:hypothetical protein
MAVTVPDLRNLNLDCEDPTTLDHIAHHLDHMRKYAVLKSEAMHHRSEGRIQDALDLESQCQSIYATLPTAWRW